MAATAAAPSVRGEGAPANREAVWRRRRWRSWARGRRRTSRVGDGRLKGRTWGRPPNEGKSPVDVASDKRRQPRRGREADGAGQGSVMVAGDIRARLEVRRVGGGGLGEAGTVEAMPTREVVPVLGSGRRKAMARVGRCGGRPAGKGAASTPRLAVNVEADAAGRGAIGGMVTAKWGAAAGDGEEAVEGPRVDRTGTADVTTEPNRRGQLLSKGRG